MQKRHICDVILMRIKWVVKNVITFDLIFDTNQKRANPIFRAVSIIATRSSSLGSKMLTMNLQIFLINP